MQPVYKGIDFYYKKMREDYTYERNEPKNELSLELRAEEVGQWPVYLHARYKRKNVGQKEKDIFYGEEIEKKEKGPEPGAENYGFVNSWYKLKNENPVREEYVVNSFAPVSSVPENPLSKTENYENYSYSYAMYKRKGDVKEPYQDDLSGPTVLQRRPQDDLQKDYSYADFQPSRPYGMCPPPTREKNVWAGIL